MTQYKINKTQKGNWFRDEDGFYCFYCDGVKSKHPSLMGMKFHMDTLYKLNGKRKIN
jgi:hypothetical protein